MKNFTLVKKVLYNLSVPFRKKIILCCIAVLCSVTAFSNNAVGGEIPFTVAFTQQPHAAIVCEGSDTSFTVAATGAGALSYQWQASTNGGGIWNNVSNGGVFSGATGATLFITGAVPAMNTWLFRCNVSDGVVNTSNAVLLTVNPAPATQVGNVAASICANGGGTLTATVFANTTYQWQVSTNVGISWANVINGASYSGAATDALVISNAAALDGFLYRYVSTNSITGCSAASSGVDTLHVNYINTTTQPATTTATCVGTGTSLEVVASGNGTLGYQWKSFPSNVNVTNNATFSGATTATLAISNPAIGLNNTRYTVTINNNGACPVVLGPYTLQVRALTAISANPQSTNTCATGNASFSVTAAGSGNTFQWQTDNGTSSSSWSDITTGNPLNLTGVSMSMNGYRYRVVVTGNCGNATSSEATLTVRSSGTWLGAVDTNWHVPGNWCGGVPISTTDVLIPNWAPRMPTISNTTGTAFFHSIVIENTSRLEIKGGTIDNMTGPFDIQGTVAYTAPGDQQVFPAPHGSLEINGGGNKYLLTDVTIAHNMLLGGTAKLVTGNQFLVMLNGSNAISGATFGGTVTSWIVTGNGNSGIGNAGLGGLRIQQLDATDGTVLFPVGPTSASYNPLQLTNTGTIDNFTIAVNDQRIPGSLYLFGIDRTWLVNESTPGGSNIALNMRWNGSVEQNDFKRNMSEVVRSDGSNIVQNSATAAAGGSDPYSRGEGSFTNLNQFSVASYVIALPVKLISFNAKKVTAAVEVTWKADEQYIAQWYTIQKSTDGTTYTDIGRLAGVNTQTNYRFTDKHPDHFNTYYRLQMTGKAGETGFSRVVLVTNGDDNTGVRMELRPSVTNGVTGLYISAIQKEKIVLTITDVAGRIQLQQTAAVQKGEQVIPLNIARLTGGIYFLHVTGSGGISKILSVLKQ
jgi:hypothetical protein